MKYKQLLGAAGRVRVRDVVVRIVELEAGTTPLRIAPPIFLFFREHHYIPI